MSKTHSNSSDSRDRPTTADDVYDDYKHAVEAMANRNDEIGAIMRAVKRIGGDDDAKGVS